MKTIKAIENNIRLDKYLIEELGLSRSRIQQLIEKDNIKVNNKSIKNSYIIKKDDEITISEEEKEDYHIKAEDIPLEIIYEDDDLIVINKASGMVVHPANGNRSKTLVNALLGYSSNLSEINGEERPGIVHRLDKDTSGLLVVAKNNETHNALSKMLQEHKIVRRYIALVEGVIPNNTGTIDAPIGRDINDRKKMSVTDINAKNAITHFTVLERFKDSTLIECRLETGRTHQIRVHMQYIGYPIINDPLYNKKKIINDYGQMLHAKYISFNHPKTQEYMEFMALEPSEFKKIVSLYKEGR